LGYVGAVRAPRALLRIPGERPVLTLIILASLVAIFLIMTLAGRSINATENDQFLVAWGAKVNSLVVRGEWWRLITATLLHAGFLHIAFNGYALYVIGLDLESFVGRARFAVIYAVSGIAGSVASFAFSPYLVPGVGASGAIFGLIGALGVYFGLNRRIFGRIGQAQFWNIVFVIVLNMGLGFSGIFPIDNSAHIGGLIAGATVGYVLCPRYRLGEWIAPNVREVVNVNKSPLSWLAAAIIAANVVLAFFLVLMLYKSGFILPQ
jgi:rhomboid protease GluP